MSEQHPQERGSCACGCVVFSNDLQRVVMVESKKINNWCPPKVNCCGCVRALTLEFESGQH